MSLDLSTILGPEVDAIAKDSEKAGFNRGYIRTDPGRRLDILPSPGDDEDPRYPGETATEIEMASTREWSEAMPFSTRLKNGLIRAMSSDKPLQALSDRELLIYRGFGRKTLMEFRKYVPSPGTK